MNTFFGRDYEFQRLSHCQNQTGAQLVVVKGRRRIGKSRLINQFAAHQATKGQTFYQFVGLAPHPEISAQMQRDEFCRLFSEQLNVPDRQETDWAKLFSLLAKHTSTGKVIILFDEISWMADKDPTFLSKLKSAWDLYFSKNPHLMLILCGSISVWIEKHLVGSTAFLGRPSLELTIEELPLDVCKNFWGKQQQTISVFEKLKILSVTGGVPRYLELIDPALSAEDNLRQLCFTKNAILLREFDKIFSDVFGKRSEAYQTILKQLIQKNLTSSEIIEKLAKQKSGDISAYLADLIEAGFVSRDYTWKLSTGKLSKFSKYRISDNYIRFYLRYIEPNREKIKQNLLKEASLMNFPGIRTILGLQFENLVINNKELLFKKLGIPLEDIVFANPYFQTQTKKTKGCQIDYLIQTRFNNLYVCEIKFSHKPISLTVIDEVQEKLKRMSLPRNFSYRPVLIQANGVTDELLDTQFFANIIDFDDILK